MTPVPDGSIVLVCRQPGVGELVLELFEAGLIIDRDGVLEEMASEAARHAVAAPASGDIRTLVAVELAEGPTGYVAEIDLRKDERGARPALPYLNIFAVAAEDLSAPGVAVVTVRSAELDWPAAAEMLATLQLGARGGAANDTRAMMPVIGRRR